MASRRAAIPLEWTRCFPNLETSLGRIGVQTNMQGHGDDWEHITVNFVRDGEGEYVQDSVTWFLSIICLNQVLFYLGSLCTVHPVQT